MYLGDPSGIGALDQEVCCLRPTMCTCDRGILEGLDSQVEHILRFILWSIAVSSLEIFQEPDRYPFEGGFERFVLVARTTDSPQAKLEIL